MVQERVSRKDLRSIRIGQARKFTLSERKKINSARVQANQLKNEEGLVFKVTPDFPSVSVTITRMK